MISILLKGSPTGAEVNKLRLQRPFGISSLPSQANDDQSVDDDEIDGQPQRSGGIDHPFGQSPGDPGRVHHIDHHASGNDHQPDGPFVS